jgi:Phage tail protein (Tail_P2_I)
VTTTADLYDLLPSIHRIRDAEGGGALEALVTVLAGEADVVDRDIERLYDDWFIETCQPWVVPYIADLLGVRGLYAVAPGTASQRAYVANTIGYRRRKGTVAVLEQLAFDVTGWRAKAVEFFQLPATTQYAKHIRLANVGTPDLRDANALELLGGPFERAAHTAEVRRIAPGRGRYNIPNVGLYLWRLQSYPISRGTAREVGAAADDRYTFSPLGLDAPLFNRPRTEAQITDLAQEIDVPAPLRRRVLFDELEARRQAGVESATVTEAYFAYDHPVLRVLVRATPAAAFVEVPPEEILIADLSLWQRPPTSKPYTPAGSTTAQSETITVAADPRLGRLTFPSGSTRDAVEVSYAYGFSGDIGGGPYDRSRFVEASFAQRVTWQAGVGKAVTLVPGEIFDNLSDAIDEWNAQPEGTVGVIAILDSRTYEEDITGTHKIELPEGSELLITAADWPVRDVLGTPARTIGEWVPQGRRPHLRGDLSAAGTAPETSEVPGRLALDGLLVEGKVTVLAGNLGRLRVADSTLVPASGGLAANTSATAGQRNAGLEVVFDRSICGPIDLPEAIPELGLSDSIVDDATAVNAIGATTRIQSCTILGTCAVHTLRADDSIFTDVVTAERRQVGCVRFCFVPSDPGVSVPRRYRCQPDLALRNVSDPVQQDAIRSRVVPTFTSIAYGHPAYGQLAGACPREIRTGADDGSEIGAFSSLKQPQRAANLRTVLDEYLRFGLEAGVFYVT